MGFATIKVANNDEEMSDLKNISVSDCENSQSQTE
jgi:hypothetical protein